MKVGERKGNHLGYPNNLFILSTIYILIPLFWAESKYSWSSFYSFWDLLVWSYAPVYRASLQLVGLEFYLVAVSRANFALALYEGEDIFYCGGMLINQVKW